MKIKKAIEILYDHNIWRRGGKGKMTEPKELGTAIDTILAYHLEIEKQEFIGKYVSDKMDKENLPYGMKYLNYQAQHEEDADKKWINKLKKHNKKADLIDSFASAC